MSGIQSTVASGGGPLDTPPIANGLSAATHTGFGSQTGADIGSLLAPVAAISATNTTTSFTDAINYTGAGVLEFCAFYNRNVSQTEQVGEIIIDGVTAFTFTAGIVNSEFRCPVGSVAHNATTYVHSIGLGDVVFKNSLQIRHKAGATAGTSYAWAKVRKTA